MRVNDGVFVSKSTKDMERAQAAFHKKEIQAREGATAAAEYKAAGLAERAKTERLRALRLARDAAAPKPEPAAKKSRTANKSASKTAKKPKAQSASLSTWLEAEQKEGRRS